ncbi:hypothetical protein [Flavobacterium sp. ASW18X]|uniref:hypothetical protein n=1 Tax=Flavobacterium sp. ASW18X TaxID=2572595 RepID=UPI0010AEC7B4|nr:hypothetical protein [Flavobacterium sp. ASW18X]TKD61432.1 hypothetical protein FBT53_11670 [Flavobacterium sp. ASW18X]
MNFKDIFENIKSYLFIGTFFFGFVIIFAGLPGRNRDWNLYFILIGLAMLLPFAIWYLNDHLKLKRLDKKYEKALADLKLRGEKVKVELDNVKIKSNKWNETVITDNTQYAGLNELVGRADRNMKTVVKNLNQVTINIPYKGKIIRYKANVQMDTDNLKIHFAIQKETTLYIDPLNNRNMYLDLEFLE